jgi:Asp/Glu/hydantoin racemase
MAEEAVRVGRRIGVLATLEATCAPTRNLLRRKASQRPGQYELLESVCADAFEALRAGDPDRHDEIVAAELLRLATKVDVLVLAQASMARVADSMPAGQVPVPVLCSPQSGVRQLRHVVEKVR